MAEPAAAEAAEACRHVVLCPYYGSGTKPFSAGEAAGEAAEKCRHRNSLSFLIGQHMLAPEYWKI